jgi:hypothetical protein
MAFGPKVRASVGASPEASNDLRSAGRLSAERALEGLDGMPEDCASSQFDPEVVEKLLVVLKRRADEAGA